jgi:catechol 2,3-dioxygenase-like lactoylglutathione lyase family enzyme
MSAPNRPTSLIEPLKVTFLYAKLPIQDVGRARAFYAERLGFVPYQEIRDHLYYQVAGMRFLLFPSSGTPSGTHDQIGFIVDDVEREVARLRARGVVFENYPMTREGIMDAGYMKAAWFKDSEGNLLAIAERVPITPEP